MCGGGGGSGAERRSTGWVRLSVTKRRIRKEKIEREEQQAAYIYHPRFVPSNGAVYDKRKPISISTSKS